MAEKGHKSWCRHVKGAGFGAYDNSCNCGGPHTEDSAMSEKTITRYTPVVHVEFMESEDGEVVAYSDHEDALAAKDARIAELEREQERGFQMLEMYGVPRQRAKQVSNGIDVLMTRMGKADRIHAITVQALNGLRTAIEAKAREWEERASEERADGMLTSAGIYEQFAAELRSKLKVGEK